LKTVLGEDEDKEEDEKDEDEDEEEEETTTVAFTVQRANSKENGPAILHPRLTMQFPSQNGVWWNIFRNDSDSDHSDGGLVCPLAGQTLVKRVLSQFQMKPGFEYLQDFASAYNVMVTHAEHNSTGECTFRTDDFVVPWHKQNKDTLYGSDPTYAGGRYVVKTVHFALVWSDYAVHQKEPLRQAAAKGGGGGGGGASKDKDSKKEKKDKEKATKCEFDIRLCTLPFVLTHRPALVLFCS
jgi:hypothetical protein